MSRSVPSNNSSKVIAVVSTANFAAVIIEELAHAARQLEKRNSLTRSLGCVVRPLEKWTTKKDAEMDFLKAHFCIFYLLTNHDTFFWILVMDFLLLTLSHQ